MTGKGAPVDGRRESWEHFLKHSPNGSHAVDGVRHGVVGFEAPGESAPSIGPARL